jgi:Uma2 family endonuclease
MTATTAVRLPTLANGDRMDREEFHRRYALRPDLHRVELIEGTVYVPSPLNAEDHAEPQHLVQMWLGAFALRHPELRAHGPATVFLDGQNEPEPDAILYRVDRGIRGADGYLHGAPDLVVEIANSSVSRDLHQKLEAYERNGVGEYIVWRVEDQAIDWFVLREGRFERLGPDTTGTLTSVQFPGLRLDAPAALDGDIARVIAGLG